MLYGVLPDLLVRILGRCVFDRRWQTVTLPLPTILLYLGVSFERMVYM
jgi:hypothetical protein